MGALVQGQGGQRRNEETDWRSGRLVVDDGGGGAVGFAGGRDAWKGLLRRNWEGGH